MAGKSGGAWKVAYADFVTAMMAFFLVMWICSQDQKIKRAVADYFGDPLSSKRGTSKTPYRTGSVFASLNTGAVPESETVAMGRGRYSHSERRDTSLATKLVADWLQGDKNAAEYWRQQAWRQLEAARQARRVGDNVSPEKVAARQLAKQLNDEFKRGIPGQAQGLYRDLLFEVMQDVNWEEIAEDLLTR